MEHLIFAFNAISPIILLIVLGYVLRKIGFINDEFLKIGNKVVFNICLPCALFANVYSVESFDNINLGMVLYICIAVVLVFLLAIGVAMLTTKEPDKRGVVHQATYRSEFGVIGLSLAFELGGNMGAQMASLIAAVSVPLFNILAVISLSMFKNAGGIKDGVKKVGKSICKNPLLWGVGLGIVCLAIRLAIPVDSTGEAVFSIKRTFPFIYQTIQYLKNLTTPFALIVLGGCFDFGTAKENVKSISVACVCRIVIVPLFALGIAALLTKNGFLNFDKSIFSAMTALFAAPVAIASGPMAEQMDNDGKLAGQLIVWSSIFSILTIFAYVVALRFLGLI
ncbi:MAG: AEC family transporter [Lachnospiraceae bacterium]|nr:AEC family transporter [Lachnospiraceae bacterium]